MKKAKKISGRVVKWIISKLPSVVKGTLIRNLITVDRSRHDEIIVKMAESIDEYEQVFTLLRKNYIEQGFVKPQEPLTLNKFQIANSSAVIIAKLDNKVIGTLTLVKKVELGLPLERVFKINNDLPFEGNAVEITCLAVDSNYRRKNGFNCLFPLMKFMYFYAKDFMMANRLFIACFPRDVDFYSAILFFKKIKKDAHVSDYLGAPATCLVLDMDNAHEVFKNAYAHKGLKRNLFSYFVEEKHDFLLYPARPNKSVYSSFGNSLYEHFASKGYQLKLAGIIECSFFLKQFGRNVLMINSEEKEIPIDTDYLVKKAS
ncbi:MAG: hypothetical protein K2Q18_04300 [Bdellovibrionales bacterium]|nr:hypothetical protein [Bdellovibrionales bacterium]